MSPLPYIDLKALARKALLDKGFLVDFPEAVRRETDAARPARAGDGLKDLTAWLWSSIDNDDSHDLDQAEFIQAEGKGWRVYVAVADVELFVPKGSATDEAAKHNTTSIYTGVETFPMLPLRLSTDLSSLNQDQDRAAVVVEMLVGEDGSISQSSVYGALIRNRAQLAYNGTAAWLEDNAEALPDPMPPASRTGRTPETMAKINGNAALKEQILLQDKAARALRRLRTERGALDFQAAQWRASLSTEGGVQLEDRRSNRASHLIEDFMIAANQTMSTFLEGRGFPMLQRVVRTPKYWDKIMALALQKGTKLPSKADPKPLQAFLQDQRRKDPERFPDLSLSVIKLLGRGEYVVKMPGDDGLGHFGLAVRNYTHSTAPNRRYPDLLIQRLLKSAFNKKPQPYAPADLDALAKLCTEKEDLANKVERFVGKCMAAVAMAPRVGEMFRALVTGANEDGTWVRITTLPVEGKVEGNVRGLKVGDHVRVRLDKVDPMRGFIDFSLL